MKKIIPLLILLIAGFSSFAQFNWYWTTDFVYTVTSGFSNEVRKVATDASGNIFVLSDVTSDVDTANHVGPTQYYVLLQKYSPSGTLLVQRVLNANTMPLSGSFDYKSAFSLVVDASGSVFIGFNKYNVIGNNYDVQVMKYTNSLTLPWTFVFASPANDSGVDIVLRGSTPFLLLKSVSGGNTTYRIAKAQPNTSTSQATYSFDANLDVVNSITTTSTLNLFVTGYRTIGGVKNVMIASVNGAGLLKWKQTFNNNTIAGDDVGIKIMVGTDGFLYIAGTTFTNATNGNDALVLRYNAANGTRNFSLGINYNLGSAVADVGYDIVQGTGGFVFLGTTKGNSDIVVHKISTVNGLSVNASASYKPNPQNYTSINSVNINAMKIASSNNIYLGGGVFASSTSGNFGASYLARFGMSGGSFSFLGSTDVDGSNTENYETMSVAFDPPRNNVIRVRNFWSTNATHLQEAVFVDSYSMGALRLGVSDSDLNNVKLSFYPNPVSDRIYFNNADLFDSITLIDLVGRVVKTFNPAESQADISDIAPGQYLLHFKSESDIKSEKIIIQ